MLNVGLFYILTLKTRDTTNILLSYATFTIGIKMNFQQNIINISSKVM